MTKLKSSHIARYTSRLAVLALLFAVTLIPTGSASAQTAGGGGVAFSGLATIPDFPCTPDCLGGEFHGSATGTAVGTYEGTPWKVVFKSAALDASFTYNEPDPCPVLGDAEGEAVLEATTGVYGFFGSQYINDLHGEIHFIWTRVGATAIIETEGFIQFTYNGTPVGPKIFFIDRAEAGFEAHHEPDHLCGEGEGTPHLVTATVVGVDLLVGT